MGVIAVAMEYGALSFAKQGSPHHAQRVDTDNAIGLYGVVINGIVLVDAYNYTVIRCRINAPSCVRNGNGTYGVIPVIENGIDKGGHPFQLPMSHHFACFQVCTVKH